MDFGYPQYTEAKILSEFIKTDAYRMEVTQRPPMAVTNAVSWRSEGIQYKKNEVGVLPSQGSRVGEGNLFELLIVIMENVKTTTNKKTYRLT
jgi:hypothetical protein